MAVKDVEMFVLEKRKNEALKKEQGKATKKEDKFKEEKKEKFFNKKLHPSIKKYGFDFLFDDFCEYKKHGAKPKSGDEELSDDELFNVAGGRLSDLTREEAKRYNELHNKKGILCGHFGLTDDNAPGLDPSEKKEYDALHKRRWRGIDINQLYLSEQEELRALRKIRWFDCRTAGA